MDDPMAVTALETSLVSAATPDDLSMPAPQAALRRPLGEVVNAALEAAGRSAHTRRAYQTAIGLFLQHLDRERGHLLPVPDWRPLAESLAEGRQTVWTFRGPAAVLRVVDAGLLDGFRAWREAAGDSPNTATQRVYAVRTFLAVALRDGILTREQESALRLTPYRQRQTRDEKPVGRRLSPAEVRALRAAVPVERCKGRRDLALLDLMLYAGLRCEEAALLDRASLQQDGGRWWLVLTGKGHKTRRIKVHDTLFKSLTAWLDAAGLEAGQAGPAFLSVNKGDQVGATPITPTVIGRLVAEYGHAAGLAPLTGANRLSPHDLRRTCARNAYDNGASLLLVQAMLGHSDPETTARYIGALETDEHTAVDYVRY